MSKPFMHPGQFLADLAKQLSVTPADIGERCGLSECFVQSVFAGQFDIGDNIASRLAPVFTLPPGVLVALQFAHDATRDRIR